MSVNSIKDKLIAQPDVPESNYTKMLCNRRPRDAEGYAILYLLFLFIGTPIGYLNAVILELQEKGANYNDQALMSTAMYPFIFKILIAPLLDRFYIQEVGKTKTWILGCLFFTSTGFFWVSTTADTLIDPQRVPNMLTVWFTLILSSAIQSIATDNFLVKLFYHDATKKGRAALIIGIGMATGIFIGYNLFVALVDWNLISHRSFGKIV